MEGIPPRIATGEEPRLDLIGWPNFQRLIRDLLQYEPNVQNAEVFGLPRQPQLGIDVKVRMFDGTHLVAQCKCYEKITAAQIIASTNEFLNYVNEWKPYNVKRFILATAADGSNRKVDAQIEAERLRFREFGIEYGLWSRAGI